MGALNRTRHFWCIPYVYTLDSVFDRSLGQTARHAIHRIAGIGESEPIVGDHIECTETVDEGWAGAPGGGFVVLGYGRDCTEG